MSVPPARRGRGFTLLEMLLALTLISILAASLYASLSIGFRARRSADRVLREGATLQLALELLRSDLESALPPRGVLAGAFLADDETVNGDAADTLTFHTLRTRPLSGDDVVGCDVHRIELLLVDDDEPGRGHNLVRRVSTNLLATRAAEGIDEVLCRDVRSLNLRYYDGLDWLDAWDSSTLEGELPLAIEVTLQVGPADATASDDAGPSLTRVFLIPSVAGATAAGRGRLALP